MVPAETVLLTGPTGAGKTDLSHQLAERIGGEIVCADAFQVYAGLPILTSQPSASQKRIVPHHLFGCVSPTETYDVGRYLRDALPLIHEIIGRGKVPIVVGGTGLYVKALLGGLDVLPGNDPSLREEFAKLPLSELVARLRGLDPIAESMLDLANRRRVERAIEIVTLTGKPLSESRRGTPKPHKFLKALLIVRDRATLNARIASNVQSMFDHGVEKEVASLSEGKTGVTAAMTLGLREIRALLRGETTSIETKNAMIVSTRRYAKRQMTWFRNQHGFAELNPDDFPDITAAVTEIIRLLDLCSVE